MIQELQIRVLPPTAASEEAIRTHIVKEKGIAEGHIRHLRILKRSIDARHRTIFVKLTVRVYINEEPDDDIYSRVEYGDVSDGREVVVVGAGPGGLFASLKLIELGLRPILIERGKMCMNGKKTSRL